MEDVKWMSDTAILKGIGEKIKEWRLEMDLSQAQLAYKAQLGLFTIRQVEHGKSTSSSHLIRILRILDRLDTLTPFLQEKEISPLELQKIEAGMKTRRRASKKQDHDTDNNGSPLW